MTTPETKLSPSGLSEDELRALAGEISDEEARETGIFDEIQALRGEQPDDETGDEPATETPDDEGAAGLTSEEVEEVEEPAAEPEPRERDEQGRFKKGSAQARIKELNDRAKAAEAREAALEVRLAALEQAKSEPREPEPAPVDPLDEIKAQKKALAAKYNAGEIDFEELEAARDEIEDKRLAIVMERNRPDPVAMQRDAAVQGQIEELDQQHAWFGQLPDALQYQAVEMAKTRAAQEGLVGNAFRLQAVKYAIDTAIRLDLAPAGTASPLSTQPPANATRQPKVTDQKLAMARTHPPDLHAAPAPKRVEALTMEDVARLSPAELARLPQAQLDRLYAEAGIT